MGRAPCCDKTNVKRGPWSPEEDAMLKAYIEEHGTGGNWIALPHKIGLKRCGKSCRLRWLNYLRPNIKHGGFSEEEDNIICNLYISIGSRWSIIAAQLPGRTDNDIKNYWNTRLKKKLLGRRRDSRRTSSSAEVGVQKDGSGGMSSAEAYSQTLSASAIERMQLHMQVQGHNSPFSFYNNPTLWPNLHPLAERRGTLQAPQSTEAIATSGMLQQQLPPTTTLPDPSLNVPLPCDGEVDANSLYGLPSASDSGTADHARKISKGIQSTEERIQEELMSLIYAKNTDGAQSGEQQQPSPELDCFKEMYSDKDSLIWWANNGFVEKSSSSSWESTSADLQPESIFQDYMLGYDV